MGARHGDTAANHNSTHFLVWSTGLLLIFFGRPDGKLFLSFLPILLWVVIILGLDPAPVNPPLLGPGQTIDLKFSSQIKDSIFQ